MLRSVSVACVVGRRSPWPAPFPLLAPRKFYLLCSSTSSVLWRSPTPPKRTCPDDGSFTFPDRSARADVLEVSRFSCTLLADVPGLFDYAEPSGHSRITQLAGVAFPLTEKGRHSGCMFSELNHPARQPSVYASLPSLTGSQARLEAGIESLLLFRRALSSPTMCRFIPALSVPQIPRKYHGRATTRQQR